MATGGYKCVSFSWTGGRGDSVLNRTKFIINGISEAIISANIGWQYDTLTPTSSDFLTMPSSDNSSKPNLVQVLKLEYNNHTYRVGIGYTYSIIIDNYTLKPEDVCPCKYGTSTTNYSYTGKFGAGLYWCMIKDGTLMSDSTYNWVWNGNGQFLKWMPFVMNFGSSGSASNSCCQINNSSVTYLYYIILKGTQVGLFFRCSNWNTAGGANLKGAIAGDIFKETGHLPDTTTLGSVGLSDFNEYESSIVTSTSSNSYLFINAYPSKITLWHSAQDPIPSQIIAADGTVYSNTFGDVVWKCRLWFDAEIVTYPSQITSSPGGRWTPCYMYLQSNDHDTYYVVPGDGFKGFIDTDLLRGVNPNYSYGQQLDSGKFIYIGGGFAIGWDPSNTIPLF